MDNHLPPPDVLVMSELKPINLLCKSWLNYYLLKLKTTFIKYLIVIHPNMCINETS